MEKLVRISEEAHKTLNSLAAKKNRSLKDFVEQAINYFQVLGLDPKEIDSESIRAEIKKLDTRIVSFFKTQEKQMIQPLLEELSIISKTLIDNIKIAPDKKDFVALSKGVATSIQSLIESHKSLSGKVAEVRLKELSEIKQKARKLFNDYLDEVENKGTLASRKPIDDKYRKLLESI